MWYTLFCADNLNGSHLALAGGFWGSASQNPVTIFWLDCLFPGAHHLTDFLVLIFVVY